MPLERVLPEAGRVAIDQDVRAIGGVPQHARALLPGLGMAVLTAVVATALGRMAPVVGAPVFAIVIGVLLAPLLGAPPGERRRALAPGLEFASRAVLQCSVVTLGTQLSLGQVVHIGLSSMPVMVGTLVACLAMAAMVGRWLGVSGELSTLIGVGTGICGASAIAAVSSVTRPRPGSIAYAVSTIFVFNVVAVLLFPPLGHLLHLDQQQFGLFAGTAVNDTSSVVAAATTYGHQAGEHAVVVKLTRTLMIIPVCLVLSILLPRRGATPSRREPAIAVVLRLVPWFLIGFLVCAGAGSAGLIGPGLRSPLQQISLFLIATALAGIGFSTDAVALRRTGLRPVLLGAILWATVATTSLLLQALV